MLRRLGAEQPAEFSFTEENDKWVDEQIAKYPEGRAQSAVIPVLWRAQEQEGWLSRPAIEAVATRLGMPYMRALEVATFYFMFQLSPVGKIAHVQVCGTTSCMLRGSDDLIALCQKKIARNAHEISDDGNFSWEEVECLGACTHAPMVQIGKDYYEDLTADKLNEILDAMAAGKMPIPGPQAGRFAAEPHGGVTSLDEKQVETLNASAALAQANGDSIARIERPGKVKNMPEIVDLSDGRPSADRLASATNKATKTVKKATKAVKSAGSKVRGKD